MSRRSVAKKTSGCTGSSLPKPSCKLISKPPFKEGEEKYRLQHFLFGNEEYCRDNITRST